MSGPFIPERAGQPLDMLNQAMSSDDPWGDIDAMFKPHLAASPMQPADNVARALWLMYDLGGEGRAVIEWLMDITLRMPYRATGSTFEQTALLTATRQGINGVGEAVLAAIAHGKAETDKLANQNGAGK